MRFSRFLMFPFALIYGLGLYVRNRLYDRGIMKSEKFAIPVIAIGNLSTGGTGKTPHTEYLIKLLKDRYKVATLSRGYGRKTKGFVVASKFSSVQRIGDEPRQYIQKFEDVVVSVDEKRRRGIRKLQEKFPGLEVVLLDDAFQHRALTPGLSILLTDYRQMYTKDHLLPTGNLRDLKHEARRADIIVVTKTPRIFSPITKRSLIEELKPEPAQKVFFSYLNYGTLQPMNHAAAMNLRKKYNTLLMLAGIANTYPLEEHLTGMADELVQMVFPDHHQYTSEDLDQVTQTFSNIVTKNKVVVTTEKDAMRIRRKELLTHFRDIPLFYIPIEVAFHKEDKSEFDNLILRYVRENKGNY